MDCKYCKNKFTNISSLNKHIKYANYCKKERDEKEETPFICEGCDKNFTSNYNLTKQIQKTFKTVEQVMAWRHEKEKEFGYLTRASGVLSKSS